MDLTHLETERASIAAEYLVRVQIPPDAVARVLVAITSITPLKYGNYEQVAFRSNTGTLQFKPLEGLKPGKTDLFQLPSDEINLPSRKTINWLQPSLKPSSRAIHTKSR